MSRPRPRPRPTINPAINILSFAQIARNFDKVSTEELKRHKALQDFDKITYSSPERARQLLFVDKLISLLKKSNEYNDAQKALILVGALLDLKAQIAATYNWLSPDGSIINAGSYVYQNVNQMIGSLDKNKFDAETEKACQEAFVEYISEPKRLVEVMRGVEKAHLLKFAFRAKQTMDATELSTAADLMRKMKPDSKHHVVVPEKASTELSTAADCIPKMEPEDTLHIVQSKKHKRKDHLYEIKAHTYSYDTDPDHYVETSKDAPEVKAEKLEQIDTSNKMSMVNFWVKKANSWDHRTTFFNKAQLKKVEPKVTHDVVVDEQTKVRKFHK